MTCGQDSEDLTPGSWNARPCPASRHRKEGPQATLMCQHARMDEPQLPEFGQDADEYEASRGPFLHQLPAAEVNAARVQVRCDKHRTLIAIITSDLEIITRRHRRPRSTRDEDVHAPCPDCVRQRDDEGYTLRRTFGSAALWSFIDNPPAGGRVDRGGGVKRSEVLAREALSS